MTNQFNTRIGQQLNVLQTLEQIIDKASKVTITPTRITIKSHRKVSPAYYAQVAVIAGAIEGMGHLPFTVEVVPHG